MRLPFPSVKPHTTNFCCGRDLIFGQSGERLPGPVNAALSFGNYPSKSLLFRELEKSLTAILDIAANLDSVDASDDLL